MAAVQLRPHQLADLRALHESAAAYERRTGLRVAAGVRDFLSGPEVSEDFRMRLASSDETDGWRDGFGIVEPTGTVLVGLCSYGGPPDSDGVVEISYGLAPEFRGRGYAVAAARILTERAFTDDSVRTVCAHTLPEESASTAVLRRCGFTHAGEIMHPEDGRVWRWERRRD